eukprot:7162893-Ditylum_brightwellii.AAC.1
MRPQRALQVEIAKNNVSHNFDEIKVNIIVSACDDPAEEEVSKQTRNEAAEEDPGLEEKYISM